MPLKYLIRIRLIHSTIKFDPEFAPGILTVAQIQLEKEPENLEALLQQVKTDILRRMFTVEIVEDDSAIEVLPVPEAEMAYVQ